MSILLIIAGALASAQWYKNHHIWSSLVNGDWDNNQFKAHCPILGHLTDQENAAPIYLIMLGYEIIIIILAFIIAFDWPDNPSWLEYWLGIFVILSRLTIVLPMSQKFWKKYKN